MLREASNSTFWNVLRGRFAAPQDEDTSFRIRLLRVSMRGGMVEKRTSVPRRFLSAKERMLRRERIFARLREGWAYGGIAHAERLSSKRISQIVSKTLQRRAVDSASDHAMLQLSRLEPALRLAAGALAEGDVEAISPYLKLLDRLDLYQKPVAAVEVYDDKAREKLLAKMNRALARVQAEDARKAAKAAASMAAARPANGVGGPPAQEAGGETASQTGNNLDFGVSI